MKKLLSLSLALLIVVLSLTACDSYKNKEFYGIVIGSYKDYISVTTLDENVDFYDANIVVNVSSLDFKVKNGQILKITIDRRGEDDFGSVQITPQSVKLYENQPKTITVDEAYDLINSATFVDARSRDEFNLGHIENAVCLTYKTMEKNYKKALPDKEAKIIVYAGSKETAQLTASHLTAFGYKNVYILGDIDDWKHNLKV